MVYLDMHIYLIHIMAVINWVKNRHNWEIKRMDHLSPGVIPALNASIAAFTRPGDSILIQTPVYPPFFRL